MHAKSRTKVKTDRQVQIFKHLALWFEICQKKKKIQSNNTQTDLLPIQVKKTKSHSLTVWTYEWGFWQRIVCLKQTAERPVRWRWSFNISCASVSLFSVTFCRQIISNSVFLSATQEKKEQQHHLFVVAHFSVTRNTTRRKKVEFPAELSALKLTRTRGAPGLLKARPQFYLFPCYFRIRARVFFFFFLSWENVFCLCVVTPLWTANERQGAATAADGCAAKINRLYRLKTTLEVHAKFETAAESKQFERSSCMYNRRDSFLSLPSMNKKSEFSNRPVH